jgi:hypothetical protein
MNEHLKTILKTVEQMKCCDRLVPIVEDMGFLIIKTIIMGGIIQYGNVPEPEESEEQDETGYHLEQLCCSGMLELLRQEVDSKEEGEIQEDDSHEFQMPYSSSAKMRLTFCLI